MKNRPKDWLSGNLQWPRGLSEAQFLQIKEQWFSVIDSNLEDADIIGRAGQFISGRDTSAAEILFKTAQTLDKENICWSRMLTYNYMRQAEVGTLDQKAMYTELTFESADATLSAEQHDGEKNGLLTELCEFSLIKRDTKRAHYYAESLKKHVDKYGVKHQLFQAYCFLGRAALLNDDIETANNCLIQASKCGYFPALKLANDLLQRGERKTVLFFLQMCLASACEDRAIVSDWVRQIENNQTPTLAI